MAEVINWIGMWEKKHGNGFAGVKCVAWMNRAVAGFERAVA